MNKDGVRLTIISVCLHDLFHDSKDSCLLHLVHVDTGTLHNTMALSLPHRHRSNNRGLGFCIFIFNGGNFVAIIGRGLKRQKVGLAGIGGELGEVMIRLGCLEPCSWSRKASTLSQMGIIVSTLGAILILKERKQRRKSLVLPSGPFVMLGGILVTLAG